MFLQRGQWFFFLFFLCLVPLVAWGSLEHWHSQCSQIPDLTQGLILAESKKHEIISRPCYICICVEGRKSSWDRAHSSSATAERDYHEHRAKSMWAKGTPEPFLNLFLHLHKLELLSQCNTDALKWLPANRD